MDTPPYARIAASLRARIEAGELATGDRVPSTRELTREWQVAMATATKALTTLRLEGLVRAVPGIGTVVAAPPTRGTGIVPGGPQADAGAGTADDGAAVPHPVTARRRPTADPALDRELVVATAIAIADAEGITAVSMRHVAARLGVATMSLYRYVDDKDDLLLEMLDAACRTIDLPPDPPVSRRARLEIGARSLWAVFRRHPWLAPTLSLTRPQPIRGGLGYSEWMLSGLDSPGLDAQTRLTIHITLFNYVRGTAVNLESEAEAAAASGLSSDEWMDSQQQLLASIVAGGRYPAFEQLIRQDFDFDLDALFDFGLQRLLDGLAPMLGPAAP